MLTMSCTRRSRRSPDEAPTKSGTSFQAGRPSPGFQFVSSGLQTFGEEKRNRSSAPGRSLFHLVGKPVLDQRDLCSVPTVDAIILLGAEMVVLGPFDRAAAQALEIDLEVLHRRLHLGGSGLRTSAPERRLDHHAGDPAFGHLIGRIF